MDVSHKEEKSSEKTYWNLYFNEASNALGHGIGVVLITPEGEYCPFIAQKNLGVYTFECMSQKVNYAMITKNMNACS